MRTMKVFGLAFALAGAAFVFTMLKDPPKIPTGIPTGDYDAN